MENKKCNHSHIVVPPKIIQVKELCECSNCGETVPARQVRFKLDQNKENDIVGQDFLDYQVQPAIYALQHYEERDLINHKFCFGPHLWLTTYQESEENGDRFGNFYIWPMECSKAEEILEPNDFFTHYILYPVQVWCMDEFIQKDRIVRFNESLLRRFKGVKVLKS